MNWEAISAVGEVLGAISVLATLFYLAAQIKLSAVATRTSSELQITNMEQEWFESWVNDAELQKTWDRVANGEATETDKGRFLWKIAQFCTIAQGVFDQYENGMVSERCWENCERAILGYLQYEFVREWWDGRDGNFSPTLYEHINLRLSGNPSWMPKPAISARDA